MPATKVSECDWAVFQAQLRVNFDKFREHLSGAMPVVDCSHQLRARFFLCVFHFDLSSWIAAKRLTLITGRFINLKGESNHRLFSVLTELSDSSHNGFLDTNAVWNFL